MMTLTRKMNGRDEGMEIVFEDTPERLEMMLYL